MGALVRAPGVEVEHLPAGSPCWGCGTIPQDGVLASRGGAKSGLCRSCSSRFVVAWAAYDERLAQERADGHVERVAVLVARKRFGLPVELASSYLFLTVSGELPTIDVSVERDEELPALAVEAALAAGCQTWVGALAPCYQGRDLSGRLVRVYRVRVEGDRLSWLRGGDVSWSPWPMEDLADRGFGWALDRCHEQALVAELSAGRAEPCLRLNEVSVRYVELTLARMRDPDADASMLDAYRLLIPADVLREVDEIVAGAGRTEEGDDSSEDADGEAAEGDDAEGESDGDDGGEEAYGSEEGDGDGDSELEDGFARPPRKLDDGGSP